MTLQEVRKEFPALQRQTFLDSACVSLAPQRAVEKLRSFLDMAAYCPPGPSTQFSNSERFRSRKTPVDAIACGAHKWIMAPFGCGFLDLSTEFRTKVKPPIAGYLSVAEPRPRNSLPGLYWRAQTFLLPRRYETRCAHFFVSLAHLHIQRGTIHEPHEPSESSQRDICPDDGPVRERFAGTVSGERVAGRLPQASRPQDRQDD